MTIIENWLPVVGFEGAYEVSDQGRVRSLDRLVPYGDKGRLRKRKGQLLTPQRNVKSGHLQVRLGERFPLSPIHHLVLNAFVGLCPEGQECRHLDDDPTNNRLINLQWGTRSENIFDGIRNGKRMIDERYCNARLTAEQARRVKYGDERSRDLVSDLSISETTVRDIRRGRKWRHI